jgi:diguanylate cyclase (GGDEF)-like protein
VTIVLLVLAALAAAVLACLWARALRRVDLVRKTDERRLTQIGELERRLRELETDESHERAEVKRLVRDRDVARAWVERLRHELNEARDRAGVLGDADDTKAQVLRVAIELLGASKGLLLTHQDADGDGDLDLVAQRGFAADPEHSALVQHLAKQTLSEQETLRIDHPGDFGAATSDADDEIDNLVAIPLYIRDRFHGVVVAANKPGGFNEYDDELLLALGDHASVALQNARLHGRLRNAYVATVRVLAEAIEAKDPFLRGHCDEVSALVAAVAQRLELDPKQREELLFASLLHDVGKIGISERILLKRGPLSQNERLIVQLHPRIGYRLVQQVPELQGIGTAVLHHHERWDGRGYPSRLAGLDIPLEARLIAIADAFSAMISERPYGTRMTPDQACEELKLNAGSQFDPELVGLFCAEVAQRAGTFSSTGAVAEALDDPELQQFREPGDGVLGSHVLAATDNTTLLYSHRHLHEEANAHAATAALNGRSFAVVVLELTELDRINRTDGFAAGDRALNRVARAAERLAAETEGIAARLSGKRLAVILPGADERQARRLAEEIDPDVSVRVTCAGWQQGDSGADVVARAAAAPATADLG